MYSLRRVLAVRFSLTILVALALIAGWASVGVLEAVRHAGIEAPLAEVNLHILFILAGTVVMGTIATAFGAFWLARSAVAPVLEVVEQAQSITPGAPNARITAHADVAEYASLVSVLNDLLERSERAFRAQRRLVADMSHELRTPLATMQGEFEVALRSRRSPEEYQRILRSGLEEVERLTAMCDAMLLVTRAASGTLRPHFAPTDISDLARKVLDQARPGLDAKGATLMTDLRYTNGAVPLDGRLVERMLRNLVDNAVRFTPAGGSLAVGTEQAGDQLRIWVEDSGPGIPPADLPHLFEPFYRVDEARTRGESTGLGLTVAAAIVELHRGAIRAENRPDGGARFVVDLPLHPGVQDATGPPAS